MASINITHQSTASDEPNRRGTGVKSNASDRSIGPRSEHYCEAQDLRADGTVNQADWQVWYDHVSRSLDVDDVLLV